MNYATAYRNTAPKTSFTVASMQPPITALDQVVSYAAKAIITHCDGEITWTAPVLTWAAPIRILFVKTNGYTTENVIAASSATINDNQFMYVDLSETTAATLTPAVASATTATASNFKAYNRVVLAYRNTTNNELYPVWLPKKFGSLEGTRKNVDFIPIGWAIDGAATPATKSTIASTNKVDIRDFDGASNEDVQIPWQVPYYLIGSTVKFRTICFATNASAPAEGEIVAFSLAGASLGNSDILSSAVGSATTSSLTCPAGFAQYDRIATNWSSDLTITDLLAGETAVLKLIRLAESTDTYAKDIGVFGIEIQYSEAVTNA